LRYIAISGPGCQIAGFLTDFAGDLSIYTLTVITSERWYAITYALHLDKRLRLMTAFKVMTAGWLYAITMATLPLLGISGYSKTRYIEGILFTDPRCPCYIHRLLLKTTRRFGNYSRSAVKTPEGR
jgi:hypothetical protein